MDFVALDFETANESRSSPCAIGIVVFTHGRCIERFSRLIRPNPLYFNPYNTTIHGLCEEDVKDEPEFGDLWAAVQPYLEGQLILAHNASFDISVLRNTLLLYGIRCPELSYHCTRLIARNVWPGLPSYGLDFVAAHLGIEFQHHNAVQDAFACAEVARRACETTSSPSIRELTQRLGIGSGRVYPDGYEPPGCRRISPGELVPTVDDFDTNHPLFGSVVIFTGTLKSMTRAAAMQKVVDVGGRCKTTVTRDTDYLVVGDLDFRNFTDGERSEKMRKAESLLAEGHDIEVISENDFLSLLYS